VSALQPALLVQMFQVFAYGNQGCGEAAGQVGDDDAAVALDQLGDFSSAFFAQHAGIYPFLAGVSIHFF
jgi:hypothetical protein